MFVVESKEVSQGKEKNVDIAVVSKLSRMKRGILPSFTLGAPAVYNSTWLRAKQ